jgi:predicted HAD superfamily phosphohydrolase YqeG
VILDLDSTLFMFDTSNNRENLLRPLTDQADEGDRFVILPNAMESFGAL